ncbi:MAG: pyridoxal-phosphate dependent enzyme [Holophaga sp.]|nr:pyridoxal-phosphate dependent enzyme [Holophaga sp.]
MANTPRTCDRMNALYPTDVDLSSLTGQGLVRLRTALASHLRMTPLLSLNVPTPFGVLPVIAKLDLLQVTGSFKVRGALAGVMGTPSSTVVACTGGNHGLGIAHAAQALGRRAVIFAPQGAAETKLSRMRALGAEVRQPSDDMIATFEAALAFTQAADLPMVHPYDQAEVIAGQATLGLELTDQAPWVRQWLVAVGGGGLASGLQVAFGGAAEVVPVEPENCPALAESQRWDTPTLVTSSGLTRTSLGAPSLGALPWKLLRGHIRPVIQVSEAAIAHAQSWLWQEARLVAEPGGVTALAALLSGVFLPEGPVGLILCGSNVDGVMG